MIGRLEKLIAMSEEWADGCAETTGEDILMNCARCLEDAIQQSEAWHRSVKAYLEQTCAVASGPLF